MRNLLISLALLSSIVLGGCAYAAPDAGHEAVLIMKPYAFGNGGIADEPVKAGRDLIAFSTTAVMVDMRPQRFDVKFDDLLTSDGMPLDFNSVLRLRCTNSVQLISGFGVDWYKNNVEPKYNELVRQEVRRYSMKQVLGSDVGNTAATTDGQPAAELPKIDISKLIDDAVTAALKAYLIEKKIPVDLEDATLGRAMPPAEILAKVTETAAEDQARLTQIKSEQTQLARKKAEEARASADNAYNDKMGLTPSQYVTLEQIKMLRETCGGGKCTFFFGGNGDVQLTRPVQ